MVMVPDGTQKRRHMRAVVARGSRLEPASAEGGGCSIKTPTKKTQQKNRGSSTGKSQKKSSQLRPQRFSPPNFLASLGKQRARLIAVPAFTRGARRLNGVLSGMTQNRSTNSLGSVYRQCLVGMRLGVLDNLRILRKFNGRESPYYKFSPW